MTNRDSKRRVMIRAIKSCAVEIDRLLTDGGFDGGTWATDEGPEMTAAVIKVRNHLEAWADRLDREATRK